MIGRSLLPLAFAGFAALGLSDGALGVAWPSIAEDVAVEISRLGVLVAILVAGYFLSSLAAGRLIARFGIGRVLVASGAIGAAALAGFVAAPAWPLLVAATFLVGTGNGLVDAGINAYTALAHGPRVMNLLHASFGVGATVGPLLVTALIVFAGSWRAAYVVLAGLQIALTASFLATRARWRTPPRDHTEAVPVRTRRRLTMLALGVFLLYTGLEVAAGQWAFTVMTEGRGLAAGAAGVWVAVYWACLTLGRLAGGVWGHRISPQATLAGGMIAAICGAAVFWWDPGGPAGPLGLALLGFGLAPVFPTMVLLTPRRVGADRAARVMGYQFAAASIGAAAVPAGIGLLVAWSGLGTVGPTLAGVAVALLALSRVTETASLRAGRA